MNWLEVIGFLFGVAGVWLTIKENIWCFPIGIIAVSAAMIFFYEINLRSNAVQQFVYIPILIFGWYNWNKNKIGKSDLSITTTNAKEWLFILIAISVTGYGMGTYFKNQAADLPYIDAFATATCFAAQYLIAKKKIENWWLWIIINPIYLGISFYKEAYLYMILYGIYFVLAIIGLNTWNKQRNVQSA